jgi:haloacetate dehalogenase
LWGKKAKIEEWYDPIEIWQDWAENVTGNFIDCGHYLPEEKPKETCNHLLNFFL